MDPYSSGEELVIKIRKPYTITKQREQWTEEEHSRFLEALKLYGRAWQRIEEHIGTKTAVQIRSHAQKFFTKLEKEALVKGLPVGQAIDIEIPPPRPKRKPTNPYPRKTSVGTPTSQAGTKDEKPLTSECSLHAGKHVLDLEKEPSPEKQSGVDPIEIGKENREGVNCCETFSFFKEAPSGPLSSANGSLMSLKASDSRCTFKELVPILKEVVNEDATNESYVTVEPSGSWNIKKLDSQQTLFKESHTRNPSKVGNSHSSHGKLCAFLSNDIEAVLNYPRHVPVHVVGGTRSRNVTPDISYEGGCLFHQMGQVNEHPNLFGNVATASTTEHHSDVSRSAAIRQSIPPFTPMHSNLDDCQSFVHTPSTFSSLVASALLQNPAAYAAASFAATFWPFSANMETCPARQINSAPSLAAVAAATVAAATAWWAAHGLLPLCTTPFNTGYTCSPIARPMGSSEAGATNSNTPDPALKDQKLGPKYTKASEEQPMLASSKSPLLSSSSLDSAEVEDGKLDPEKAEPVTELHDSSKMKVRKPVDRSSCGSNTPSSSEVETDALEKHDDKGKEEPNEHDDVSNVASDPSSNHRGRICSNPNNESWKEVSEGGRLAFQALFSREVLPQSFSPPNDHQNNNSVKQQHTSQKEEKASVFDLNSEACGAYSSNQLVEKNNERFGYVKFKGPRRTGFKPYKRCSVEAKESRVAAKQDEIKAPKRMRLEGGPSGC